jgi:hypothetical protein
MIPSRAMLAQIWPGLGGPSELMDGIEEIGEGSLPSAFPMSNLASATTGASSARMAEFIATRRGCPRRRLPARVKLTRLAGSSTWQSRPEGSELSVEQRVDAASKRRERHDQV